MREERRLAKLQDEAVMNFKLMEKGLPCDPKYEEMLEGCTELS